MNGLSEQQHRRLMGWQSENLREWETCRRMQDFAVQHLDLPINVSRGYYSGPRMTLPVEGTIHDFRAMVETVSERLGEDPDDVKTEVEAERVTLRAYWRLEGGISLQVYTWDAKGCKLDPREPAPVPTFYGKPGKLHPECRAILEAL